MENEIGLSRGIVLSPVDPLFSCDGLKFSVETKKNRMERFGSSGRAREWVGYSKGFIGRDVNQRPTSKN